MDCQFSGQCIVGISQYTARYSQDFCNALLEKTLTMCCKFSNTFSASHNTFQHVVNLQEDKGHNVLHFKKKSRVAKILQRVAVLSNENTGFLQHIAKKSHTMFTDML